MSVIRVERRDFPSKVSVLIIGGGGAGLCAALAAHEHVDDCLVIERDAVMLGSTAMSTSLLPAAETRFQRAANIDDSVERFTQDILRQSRGQTDESVVRAVTAASAATVEWLIDRHNVPLALLSEPNYPGHSRLRMHATPNRTGAELMGALSNAVAAAGIDVLLNATVADLYADMNGRVLGISYRRPDGAIEEVGCDAVIFACSGFAGNPAMVREYIPEMANAPFFGHIGNKGDALRWGQDLGAAVADIHSYQGHGGLAYGHNIPILWPLILLGGFQVNRDGERFGDEGRGPVEHAPDVAAQPGGVAWSIYDAQKHEFMKSYDDYQQALRAGCVEAAESWHALAAKLGLPGDQLAQTAAIVESVKQGRAVDPFGRSFERAQPLTPPYYAAKVTAALFHTQGGLAIDPATRVLKSDGTTFPNLFAAGGAARGLSGPSYWGYMPGNGLLSAIVLGRLAGQEAGRQVTS